MSSQHPDQPCHRREFDFDSGRSGRRNRTVKSGALYMFQSELSGARSFRISFCRYPLPNRARASEPNGWLPAHKRTSARTAQPETNLRTSTAGGRVPPAPSLQPRPRQQPETQHKHCIVPLLHHETAHTQQCTSTHQSAPATKFGARKSQKIAGLQAFEHGGKAE